MAPEHHAYLKRFAETRRMKRYVDKIVFVPDPLREAVGLPVGPEGAYFVAGAGTHGDVHEETTVLAYNREPEDQPGLWCPWHPSDDGMCIVPQSGINDSGSSFTGWLMYIMKHFWEPWGYVLNGEVRYFGEDAADRGVLRLRDNRWR